MYYLLHNDISINTDIMMCILNIEPTNNEYAICKSV